MPQTVSITEARDTLPALLNRLNEVDEPVIVTNRNKPSAIILPYESYQRSRRLEILGAKHELNELVNQMEQIVAILQEVYRPDSYDLINGQRDLGRLANDIWTACHALDKPRRHLASIMVDGFLNLDASNELLTAQQLAQLSEIIPLFHQSNLENNAVSQAELSLVEVGFDTVLSLGDALPDQYFPIQK